MDHIIMYISHKMCISVLLCMSQAHRASVMCTKTLEIEDGCGIVLLFSYASKSWKTQWNKRENFVSE